MSFIQRFEVPVTTIADGSATVYSPNFTGKIISIRYVKADYATGVDFDITSEATGETVWAQSDVNASVTVAPRQATHSTVGVAGTAVDQIGISEDRLKIVIAQGGDTKVGTFHILVE